MYVLLKDAEEASETRHNFMTVPAVIKELEKIEMIRFHLVGEGTHYFKKRTHYARTKLVDEILCTSCKLCTPITLIYDIMRKLEIPKESIRICDESQIFDNNNLKITKLFMRFLWYSKKH